MKFQKYMAVGILGLTMALGFSGCQSENQKNQDAYRKIGINSMAEGDYDKAHTQFSLHPYVRKIPVKFYQNTS